ncbi:9782_t:CDS:2, partial [Racocetra persica]
WSLIETPDDNTNLFSVLSTSILAVYFMLTDITKFQLMSLKKYIKDVEDKKSLPPEILKIAEVEDSKKELEEKIEVLSTENKFVLSSGVSI